VKRHRCVSSIIFSQQAEAQVPPSVEATLPEEKVAAAILDGDRDRITEFLDNAMQSGRSASHWSMIS